MDDQPVSKRSPLKWGQPPLLNERSEQRAPLASKTAMLDHNGRRHVVRLVNMSSLGVMIAFQGEVATGEEVTLHLLDHGAVRGQVRWSSEGRIGINFSKPLDVMLDRE
ncbi:MAG: PilZ domain-containing protein [Sphingomicrobium sp.]